MAEKGKGKSRSEITQRRRRDGGDVRSKKRKNLSSNGKHKEEKCGDKKRRSGPRLPKALKNELERLNPTVDGEASDDDGEIDSDAAVGNDVYEYEEGVAGEESMKNMRIGRWHLMQKRKMMMMRMKIREDMLECWRRLLDPADAFGGRKKKDLIISEAYPES